MKKNNADFLKNFIDIGTSFYSETNLSQLLYKILDAAIEITACEGGSLYVREKGEKLRFHIIINKALGKKQIHYQDTLIDINNKSLVGYAAMTGEIINISDAYNMVEKSYSFDSSYDSKFYYKTKSVLVLPLKDSEKKIIGIIQLINAHNKKGTIISFSPKNMDILLTLSSQAAIALKNTLLLEELRTSYLDTIYRLAMAAEMKDSDTYNHLRRVSSYAAVLARELNLSHEEQEYIQYASPMHDIGKIAIPDNILKKKGLLNFEERKIMETHTRYGAKIFADSKIPILQYAYQIILGHHEKWNGTGYPYGVKGKDIPLAARIVALVDVYDALRSKRSYKEFLPLQRVLNYIKEQRGKHFDPECVDIFISHFKEIRKIENKFQD